MYGSRASIANDWSRHIKELFSFEKRTGIAYIHICLSTSLKRIIKEYVKWMYMQCMRFFKVHFYVRISLTNDELGHPPKSNRVVFLGEENNVNRIKSISKIFTSLSKLYVMFVLRRILKRIIISNYSAVYLNEGKWRLNHRKRLFALITEIRYFATFCIKCNFL